LDYSECNFFVFTLADLAQLAKVQEVNAVRHASLMFNIITGIVTLTKPLGIGEFNGSPEVRGVVSRILALTKVVKQN
jgi:hypothetical protein